MEAVKSQFKKLTISHVFFVCLCGVIAYLFRARESYYLKPVWRKRTETQHFMNGQFPTEDDRLPSPIITDLESDGVNEIVILTNDMKLSIMALPDEKNQTDEQALPHVQIKHRVKLPIGHHQHLSRPVVMATGFTVPYSSMMQVRKQIIVIVTSNWQVFCYSSELELLWKIKLQDISKDIENYKVKTMGILVTSHSVNKNDEGLIIIGGSFTHKQHKQILQSEWLHGNHTVENDELSHFSTFALSGSNGTIRWHHLPGDFGEEKQDIKDDSEEHHWKLGLRRNRLHVGESPWTAYRDTILDFLPHSWNTLTDTTFTLARFQKDARKAEYYEDSEKHQHPANALTTEHIVGYAYGGHRPHDAHEHIVNPNAVVIHNDRGIEVLNLLTGQPITRFTVLPDYSIYLDTDSDDEAERITWGQFPEHTACYIEIWRQKPVMEKIEQIPVCTTKRLVWTRSWSLEEDYYKKIPPIVKRGVAKKRGILRHLMGHHLSGDLNYDIISFTSLGRVSALDFEGNFHWQTQTAASWAETGVSVRRSKDSNSDVAQEFLKSFTPTRTLTSLQVSGKQDVVVIGGLNTMTILDLTEGNIIAEHSIPTPSIGPIVAGDFNNDGITDVILSCRLGFIGFEVRQETNHLYTMMYAVAVLLAILLTTWCMATDTYLKEEGYED
ncbi:hypothetical protein LOTGIDRAFT_159137 [Lottia gigantea]|uniref:FG-GAP repeat-containing protein n=1 Tax=Lottia gigantea TaxID=225164 RepID=V4C9C2_LOTGI|nr:hypothetical protein LOTGIDRAFT_159137 [Lottia gigantea]ESO98334.1 hypothetical protein LOTGIDRAFT_159137 [Lottia gigantea]